MLLKLIKYILIPGFISGFMLYFMIKRPKVFAVIDKYIFYNSILVKNVRRSLAFLCAAFILTFGTMASLKYLSYHSAILDLGVFDWKIWAISQGKFYEIFWGHYQPILLLYALIYKIISHPLVLVYLQLITVASSIIPLHKICKHYHLSDKNCFIIAALFFLSSSVEFNVMFDFHTDHLFIPVALWAYYFLLKDRIPGIIFSVLVMFLLKEPLLLAAAAFGIFIIFEKNRRMEMKPYKIVYYIIGLATFITGILLFYYTTNHLIPAAMGETSLTIFDGSAYGYLGGSLPEMIKTIFLKPWVWARELLVFGKFGFLISIFAPLLFISMLKPRYLIPALPALAIALLSQLPNYYGVQYHYTASIIPFVFIAFINAIKDMKQKDKVLIFTLVMSIYFNIAVSPSPVSISFWKPDYDVNYNWKNYAHSLNDTSLREAINLVPDNASLCVQNSINSSKLMHRSIWYLYPQNVEKADYVLLDIRRLLYVLDERNDKKYYESLNKVYDTHNIIFDKDGVKVFRRKGL